jgi:MFS transporter, DHA2 family, multidrug resistance protein
MPASPVYHPDGLPIPRRYWSIVTIALGLIMAVMDGAIANVALPTIAEDLHASPSFSIWIVNGYQLAVVISLLPLSSLGEIIGYRRVYLVGLALFTFASLFCALAHTLVLLTMARVIQGFGAAGIMSVNAAGILAVGTWPWLFAINIPFGIAAFLIGRKALPHTPRLPHAFDWPSAILSAIVFGVGIAGIDSAGHGEAPLYFVTEFAVAAVAGSILVRRQLNVPAPLLPVDLMRIPIFALSVCTSIASFCAQMLAYTALPFYLHYRFGYSAVEIGLLITPWPIAIAFAAPIAGRLVEHYSAGLLGGIGLLLFAGGLLSLALLPAHPATIDLVWRMALSGAGFGLFQSPNNRTMIAAAPRERSGGASGMLGTARLLGQTVGAALVALMLARFGMDGTHYSLLTAAGFALLGGVLSVLRLAPTGSRGAVGVEVREGQRLTGE